jgi:hypothetical protein
MRKKTKAKAAKKCLPRHEFPDGLPAVVAFAAMAVIVTPAILFAFINNYSKYKNRQTTPR